MIICILVLLVLLGFICHLKKFKIASYSLYLISVILFFSIGYGPVAHCLLEQQAAYQSTPPTSWGNKNVIILLGAGVEKIPDAKQLEPHMFSYGRIVKTVELYKACKKIIDSCTVLISGGDAKNKGSPEAAVYGLVLNNLGVPSRDLILEDKSKNTWQNAEFSSPIVKKIGADNVILVTSGIHMKRSLLYFSHFGYVPTPVRADYLSIIKSLMPNFYNFTLADIALSEQIGIARYYLYNFLGWNKAPILSK